jgi:hypothetical protein
MSRIVLVILIYHGHKPIDNINLLGSQQRRNVFPVRYGQTYEVKLSFKQKTGRCIPVEVEIIVVISINIRFIEVAVMKSVGIPSVIC